MIKILIIFVFVLVFYSQDKKGISDYDKARLQAKNRLSQMTKNESILQFINLNDINDPVHGSLRIGEDSFEIIDGIATIKKEILSKQISNHVDAFFESPDYINKKIKLYQMFGLVDRPVYYVLDKRYPSKVQIILNWDNRTRKYDLDSHLEGSNFHVYYRNKRSYGVQGSRVWLNRDVVRSNAYEIITIDKPSQQETYKYSVKKYRGPSNWRKRNVTVEVYLNGRLDKQVKLLESGDQGELWLVFNLSSSGNIELINRVE